MKRIALAALTPSIAMQAAAQNQQPGPIPPQPSQPTVLRDKTEYLRNAHHSFGRF